MEAYVYYNIPLRHRGPHTFTLSDVLPTHDEAVH
jgi:hypothetical protein